MNDINKLFVKSKLIPAIIQCNETGEVLMLAYMNQESLEQTIELGETIFWSRSRKQFWHKGKTSGHTQRVIAIHSDCDDDTLLIKVEQVGNACHTGTYSCFFNEIKLDNKR
ncbi:MAG: phosphoribosyl-AMP cyclohydrolase [Oscillospiraceae bacterium]|nr:phosphoribosyl-AMP cyclohydrolase [Oscillospiraceae bacterium]